MSYSWSNDPPQNPPFTASHQDKPANVVSNRLMSSAAPSTSRRAAASARAQTKQTTWQVKVGPFAVGPSRLHQPTSHTGKLMPLRFAVLGTMRLREGAT